MRAVFNWFGLSVQFWPKGGAIEAKGCGKTIDMWLGNSKARVNGDIHHLTVAPREANGTTYVPLAFVARTMGAQVSWNEKTKTVSIRATGRMGILKVGERGIRTVSLG